MNNIDFLIVTFMRYEALKTLVFSILKYYPQANIHIADQNQTNLTGFYKNIALQAENQFGNKKIQVHKLPYDCGLSRSRNYLVKNTPSPYKLILDDDFIFTPETNIEKFLTLLEIEEAGVVGGLVKTQGTPLHYEYLLEKDEDLLICAPDGDKWQNYKGITYKETGCILNFSLYKKEVFDDILWDRDLKVAEHAEFMYRLNQTKWKILYTPEVVVDHSQERTREYKAMRQRPEFRELAFEKIGVKGVHYVHNGQTTICQNGKVLSFRSKKYGDYHRNIGQAV